MIRRAPAPQPLPAVDGPNSDNALVGLALRRSRMAAGIEQRALALTMGVSIWTLNRTESGKRRFDVRWLEKLPPEIRAPVASLLRGRMQQQLRSLRD